MLRDLIVEFDLSVSDLLLLFCLLPAAWFFLSYGIGSPWWRIWRHGWLGVVTLMHSLSVLLLLALIDYAIVFGQRVDEPIRVAISGLLAFALASKVVILHYERHNGRLERRARGAEGEKLMSTPTQASAPALIPSKYTTAILTLAIVVIAGFQSALVGGISEVEAFQFAALVVGAVVTYFAPLLISSWAAALKVLGAVAGAVLAAVPPIIDTANGGQGFTPEAIVMLIFAGIMALAAQFGVDVRIDSTAKAIANPAVSNDEVYVIDPKAYDVVDSVSR